MKWLFTVGFALNIIAGMLAWTLGGNLETAFFHFLLAFVLIWVS